MKSTVSKERLFALILLAVAGLAYLPALRAGFVWDDYLYVVDNPTLRDLEGLRRIWLDPRSNSQYYPLVYTGFWIEYHLWQLWPAGYHAINVLLHAANAWMVWTLLRRLAVPGAELAALLFAVHPVHVESVAWVTERKNVLSGFFYLTAAASYLRLRALAALPRPGRWRTYSLALLLFVCALLSKSVTASLPAALLLAIYWKDGRVRARDVALLLPFFALGIAAGLHTAWLERVHVGAHGDEWSFTWLERWLIASRALCFYPAKLLWPEPLMFSYPRWNIDTGKWWQHLFGAAVVGGFALLWLARRRIGRGPLVAALFFAGTLLPALGFVDVYPMRFSFVADHFQYLASLGLIVPLAAGAARALERLDPGPGRLAARAAAGVALLALASLSFLHSRTFRDEETLWEDTLRKNPSSWMAHNNLGQILGFRNEPELASEHFRRAVELKEDDYITETNLAEALIRLGRDHEAMKHLRHALEVEPNHADAHYFLWVALGHLGQWEEAVQHLRRGSELEGTFDAHLRGARELAKAGRPRDALRELDSAEQIQPRSSAVAFARGNVYLALGEPEPAAVAYRRAITQAPGWALAQNNLGLALERLGDLARAEEQYTEALRLNPDLETARRNLDRVRGRR